MSRTPSKMVAPPPDVGEHNDEVLREIGYSAQEIEDLRKTKAI
jgi:formyl-CoA transferase